MGQMPGLWTWPTSALIVVMLAVAVSAGGVEPFDRIDGDGLIEACWEPTKKQRNSGVTSERLIGANESLRCLEDIVVDQASAMLETPDFEELKVREKIDLLRRGHQALFRAIYNEHKECERWCGKNRALYHLGEYAGVLEDIIEDMVWERNDIGF